MKYLVKASTIVIGFLCFCSMGDSISSNIIKIHETETIHYWEDKHEDKFHKYVDKWYEVLPEHPVTIILVGYQTTETTCTCLECNTKAGKTIPNTENPTFKISRNSIVSGTWYCFLYDEGKKSNQAIYFRLRVKGTIPPQQILVNHISLNVVKRKDIYTAEYFYQDGETVNVDCINSDDRCTVQMSNPFSAPVDDICKASVWGIGFPIELNSNDNGTKIHCISDCSGDKTTVEVTFVLQKEYDNTINIKINDQDVTKNMAPSIEDDRTYNINYAYFLNQRQVTITCDTHLNRPSINFDISCPNCNITGQVQDKVTLIPNIISILSCTAKPRNPNEEIIKNVVISFQPIICRDNRQLTLQGLRPNNILSESYVYEYRQGISYINYTYQYEKNENLFLNCSINLENGFNTQNQFISFNNSAKGPGINSYTKFMTPNWQHKNEQVSCGLHDLESNKTISQIWVLFRFKNGPAKSSPSVLPNLPKVSTEVPTMNVSVFKINYQVEPSLLPGVLIGILIGILVSIFVTLMYKLKRRYNCGWQKDSINENNVNNTTIVSTTTGTTTTQLHCIYPELENVSQRSQEVDNAVDNTIHAYEAPEHVKGQESFPQQEMPEYDYVYHQTLNQTPNLDQNSTLYTDMTHNQYVECSLRSAIQ